MKIEIVSSVLWLHPDPSLGFPLKSHFSPNNLLIFDNFSRARQVGVHFFPIGRRITSILYERGSGGK